MTCLQKQFTKVVTFLFHKLWRSFAYAKLVFLKHKLAKG